ncbi:MAG: sugar ABC transporter permease [Crenarchaeota archaeon]|nr:sugar ABC transporter permease [Thermoproteota archaeon]
MYLSFHDINLFLNKFEPVGGLQYLKLFSDKSYIEATMVTIRFVIDSTLLVLLLSISIALLLNQVFAGQSIMRVIVIMPWAISEFATATAGRYLFNGSYGFVNAILYRLGLIERYIDFLGSPYVVELLAFMYAWHLAPLGIFFILAGLQTIPEDLNKQAKIDGASFFTRFRVVILPFIRYAVIMTGIIATIESARTADMIIVMTGGGPGTSSQTITFYIYKVFFRGLDLGYGAAGSWLLMVGLIMAITSYFVVISKRRRVMQY